MLLNNFPAQFTFSIQILSVPILTIFWQNIGNKAKERISKRVFQENKARQIFEKTKISYPLIRTRKTPTLVFFCEFWKIFRTTFLQSTSRQLLLKKVAILKLQFLAIFLLELVISLSYCWWNASCQFSAPAEICFWHLSERMHTFFCKQDIYKLHQPEIGKKLGKCLVAPWGRLFGNYSVSSSMFFYHIVSGMFFYHIVLNREKKCAKKHLRLFRLSDFSIYYNENENENEKQLTLTRDKNWHRHRHKCI